MRRETQRLFVLIAGVALLLPMPGCFVATDLLNPGILSAVGVDPATVIPSQGRLLITYRNMTSGVAYFTSIVADDLAQAETDPTLVFATEVGASEMQTMVVDCPVGIMSPIGAGVITDTAVAELTYGGSPLYSGEDYVCGDVIEVRLVETGGTEGVQYSLEVRVLAGR